MLKIILCDTKGIVYEGRPFGMNSFKEEMAHMTNKEQKQGSLADALKEQMYLLVFLPQVL